MPFTFINKTNTIFTSIKHFLEIWDAETKSTLACFENLTDESFSKDLVHDYRTIERNVNHIVDCAASIPFAATLPVVGYEKKHYTNKAAIIDAYIKNTAAVKQAAAKWTDENLPEEIPMYGETWTKGSALWVTFVHQVHHRGQLTVLIRLAGLKVPGVYGPAKEEWEAMVFLPQAD